jgi:hypothetical protein
LELFEWVESGRSPFPSRRAGGGTQGLGAAAGGARLSAIHHARKGEEKL